MHRGFGFRGISLHASVAILLLVLSACVAPAAPGGDTSSSADPAASDGTVAMEFWYSGTTEQLAFMQAAVDEYNEMQDAIEINLIETPDSRERIATALSAGQGPDLMMYNHNMPWFFGIEAVHPLNDFVLDPEIGIDAEQISPAARETVQYAGVVQAIPINHCPGGLIYNRTIFEEAGLTDEDAPTTWEEVEALAIQLTQRDGDDVTRWGLVNTSIDWMLQEIVLSNGADWSSDDLSRYVTDPDRLVEGLTWWHSLYEEHQVMPVPSGVTWTGVEAMQSGNEAFIRGDAAMSGFTGLCGAAGMMDDNPELDLGGVITPLGPSANGERKVSLGFNGLFVMADAPDPREAYLFIKWFFDEKSLEFTKISPGSVPSTTAALDDPDILADPVLGYGSVIEALQEAELRNFHVFPGRLDVRSQEPAIAESVFLGEATPEQAVDTFLQHAEEVFDLYAADLEEFLADHQIVW